MKISHPERGGNGVSPGVVNEWLPRASVELREASPARHTRRVLACPGFTQAVATNHHSGGI